MELRLLALKQYKTYPPYTTGDVALPWETRQSKCHTTIQNGAFESVT